MHVLALALLLLGARAHADGPTAPAAKGDEELLSFRTTIGMPPPIDYTLTVYADGRVEAVQRLGYKRNGRMTEVIEYGRKGKTKSRQAKPEEFAKLRALLASPAFAELKDKYRGSTWDVAEYEFSLPLPDGKRRTIITQMLAAGQIPEVLQQVMGEMRELAKGLFQR